MQLKSLLVAAALLSNFASLTYGRAIDVPQSGISTTKLPDTAAVYYEIEPRMLKGLRKKLDDKLKAIRERKKKKSNDKDVTDGAEASDDVPLMPPPAKYTGPAPNGMDQEPELSEWNRFLDIEVKEGQLPPASGGYLMYSGQGISGLPLRKDFKDSAAEDSKIGYLNDWHDTYHGTPAFSMWADYQKANPTKIHVPNFALSFAQARRAADSKPELHMLFSTKTEPLMRDKSYWGAVEAGVITGPDSKVNKIWRYNADEVKAGEPLPPPILAWDRSLHAPFGKKIDEIDWKINPKGPSAPDNILQTAAPKV
ncbi:hypothetical protein AALT_g4024 [Alternaria alternata]|nr:hypothetical protein AALT_g4024 [Alternaria alternata]